MSNDAARVKYIAEYEHFENAGATMEAALETLLRRLGVRGQVEVRAKTVGSFVKKIHINSYADPWNEITDKLGGRVIVKTLDDLARVRAAFEAENPPFPVLWLVDKSEEADVGTLFYPGVHVQLQVPGALTSDGELIQCELQIRTKAQDLWSVPSHELVYKGLIKPPKQTERRILRLSVLTEMFDEEVRLAMQEVAADPSYGLAVLLRASEALYLTFVAEPGEDELSLEVLDIVAPALPQQQPKDYADGLKAFVDGNKDKLTDVFATYGVYSEFASQYAYWLFSQPEALVVLERVNTAPQALAEAVDGSEIQDAVKHLYAAWGVSMPEVT
jgi:putative GTP pyrophosphokinase